MQICAYIHYNIHKLTKYPSLIQCMFSILNRYTKYIYRFAIDISIYEQTNLINRIEFIKFKK